MDQPPDLASILEDLKIMNNPSCVRLSSFLISKSLLLLASIDQNKTISIWNLSTFKLLFTFPLKLFISSYTFSEDDNYLIISSRENLFFYDIKNQKLAFEIGINNQINGIIHQRNRLICSTYEYKFLLIDLTDYKQQGYSLPGYPTCITNDEDFIYFGNHYGFVYKFCLEKLEIVKKVSTQTFRVNCICLTQDKEFVVVGKDTSLFVVISALNLEFIKQINCKFLKIDSIVSIGKKVFLTSRGQTKNFFIKKPPENQLNCLIRYNMENEELKLIPLINFDNDKKQSIFCYSNSIIYSDTRGKFRKFDVETEEISLLFPTNSLNITGSLFNKVNETLFLGSEEGFIQVWDIKTKTQVKMLDNHSMSVTCFIFMQNFNVLVSGSDDADVVLWDLGNYSMIKKFCEHSLAVKGFVECLNSRYFLSYSKDFTLCLFDVQEKKMCEKIWNDGNELLLIKHVKNTRYHIEIFVIEKEIKLRIWKDLGC